MYWSERGICLHEHSKTLHHNRNCESVWLKTHSVTDDEDMMKIAVQMIFLCLWLCCELRWGDPCWVFSQRQNRPACFAYHFPFLKENGQCKFLSCWRPLDWNMNPLVWCRVDHSDTGQHPVLPKFTQTGGNVILSSLMQRVDVRRWVLSVFLVDCLFKFWRGNKENIPDILCILLYISAW